MVLVQVIGRRRTTVVVGPQQQVLGIDPGSVWQEMGQSTLEAEFAVALLEVLTGELVCGQGSLEIVAKWAGVSGLADSLAKELARDVAQVLVTGRRP